MTYVPSGPGVLNWGYDSDATGLPFMFRNYRFTDEEIAEFYGEIDDLVDVLNVAQVPWSKDEVAPDLYARSVPTFGHIWFTFSRTERGCELTVLCATCDRVDGDAWGLDLQRQTEALLRVNLFRQFGLLCASLE
jgi:hypothetical protein